MLDQNCLRLNHFGYSHIGDCNDPDQYLMGNSPDLRSNIILERINSLG